MKKSKSQAKEDKGEFFHNDKFMMMGAKIGKIWKRGWVNCGICWIGMSGYVSLSPY